MVIFMVIGHLEVFLRVTSKTDFFFFWGGGGGGGWGL